MASQFIRSTKCKVCRSPNMHIYHKLREEGKTFFELQDLSKSNGEDINHQSFRRHFQKHWFKYLDEIQKNDEMAEGIIRTKLTASVNLADEIYKNLSILRDLSTSAVLLAKEDPKMIQTVTELLREIRQTIEMIGKLRQQLDFQPVETPRVIIKKVLDFLTSKIPEATLTEMAHDLEKRLA